jgi:hypothetical protein
MKIPRGVHERIAEDQENHANHTTRNFSKDRPSLQFDLKMEQDDLTNSLDQMGLNAI